MQFNAGQVERRSYRGGFPEADYAIELEKADARVASTGMWQVSVTWRVRGERYNNLTVFENLSMSEKGYPVAINKIMDAGMALPDVPATSVPKKAAEYLADWLNKNCQGHTTSARLYEEIGERGPERHIRHYNG